MLSISTGETSDSISQEEDLSDFSSGSESDNSVALEEDGTSRFRILLQAIKSSIENLMKLSMVIRTASGRDDYLKAAFRYKCWIQAMKLDT